MVLLSRKEHKKDKFIFNFRTSKLNHLIPDFTMTKLIFIFFAIISTKNVIAQDWDKIYKESEGLRVVVKDGKYGYINKQDEVVIPLQYDKVGHFKMGLATAKENGTWKYIDQKNNVVYDKYKNEVEGMRAVYKGSKCGFINKDRKLIVPLIYDKVFDFKNGYAVVEKNKKRG